MKKYFLLFTTVIITMFNTISANEIKAFLTYSTFNVPAKSPYIETYLSVIGNSVVFIKAPNGKFRSEIDITINFTQNEEIKSAKKYTLSSPEISDTTKNYPNFIDQQRYALPNGNYQLEISIADKNKPLDKPFVTKVPIVINYPKDILAISDIQLLESYSKSISPSILTKNNYDLVPYVSNFYPENVKEIKFYAEIYNAKKSFGDGQKMIINYFIESAQLKTRMSEFSAFSKQPANDVNILLAEFNIESLPSGNYQLGMEVRDKDNKVQAVQICFFQRKNKLVQLAFDDIKSLNVSNTFVTNYKNIDSLKEFIRSLRPISDHSEIQYSENQINGKDLQRMQQYFYNFWKTRNELQPETAWNEYYKEVLKVNKQFGTYSLKGYDTDRGRVYLQYGSPNIRAQYDNEPDSYPYEIWEYYSLVDKTRLHTDPHNRQSNRKFVFIDPDLASNKYRLIHSTAKGEIYNDSWESKVYDPRSQEAGLEHTSEYQAVPNDYKNTIDDNFKNPR